MERILSSKQMRIADDYTINTLGVPSDVLVERAGEAVADEIKKRFRGGRVLVCVGKGNNGADGRVVAKHLSMIHGFSVTVMNAQNGILKLFDKKYDIIVDCIFGTGLSREITGKTREIIEKINQSGAYVVSCDIPSGVNGDTGAIMGVSVKANLTVAIGEYKIGHFMGDGIDYSGEVILRDIGISVWDDNVYHRYTNEDVARFFPHRKRNVHKGCFGKAGVIGGSIDYPGSIILSSNSLCALKMGAGYSYLGVPKSVFDKYLGVNPECILKLISDNDGKMIYNEDNLNPFLSLDSIAIGMGMGVSEDVYKIISYFLSNYKGVLIIDADGLNSISKYGVDVLRKKSCSVVLTPHVGEFCRLIKANKDEIMCDIIDKCKGFSKEYDVITVVKNATSIISNGESVFINTTGNSCLAKAGSGDVLSGIISGVTSRNKDDILGAVLSSTYIFGLAGEIASKKLNEYTVTASDVICCLTDAIDAL